MNAELSNFSTVKSAPALAVDVNAIGSLKAGAANGDVATVRKAAQQFEALLLEQMMKSMRATVGESELWDSDSTKMFQGMYDQQIAMDMATSKGIGLADILVRQLLPQSGAGAASDAAGQLMMKPYTGLRKTGVTSPSQGSATSITEASMTLSERVDPVVQQWADKPTVQVDDFVARITNGLQTASTILGVSPRVIAAHAALESGWGKREIRDTSGKNSYNLFGIKATGDWNGKSVEILTTEYVNGSPVKRRENFRAYDSYEAAFQDYANLLASNDRYKKVVNKGNDATGFGLALQSGGYATDPGYAAKLAKVARQARLQSL